MPRRSARKRRSSSSRPERRPSLRHSRSRPISRTTCCNARRPMRMARSPRLSNSAAPRSAMRRRRMSGASGALTRRATAYYKSGDLDRAIADLDAALMLRPDSIDIYRQRSNYRLDKGESTGGLADLSYALTLEPNFVPGYIDRAWGAARGARRTGARSPISARRSRSSRTSRGCISVVASSPISPAMMPRRRRISRR